MKYQNYIFWFLILLPLSYNLAGAQIIKNKMKIIIVGGGEKGLALANLLANEHQVTLIEQDEDRAKIIATKTQVLVLHGDGGDVSILRQANIGEVDYIVTTASIVGMPLYVQAKIGGFRVFQSVACS